MPPTPRPTGRPRPFLTTLALSGTTALLLDLAFPPFWVWPLIFVALVPLGISIIRRPLRFSSLCHCFLAGILFFLPALCWLWKTNLAGALPLSLYLAVYFLIFALALNRMVVDLRIPATFAMPIAWTAVEFVRCIFLEGGFPFFALGNCLAPNDSFLGSVGATLMQSADLFGVWGLTFFIMTINGFFLDVLRLPLIKDGKLSPAVKKLGAVAAALLVGVIGYGIFRLAQYSRVILPGPRVAAVQENIPQVLTHVEEAQKEAYFQRHLELTYTALLTDRPRMIIWPETMVPYIYIDKYAQGINTYMARAGHIPTRAEVDQFRKESPEDGAFLELFRIVRSEKVQLLLGTPYITPAMEQENIALLLSPGATSVLTSHYTKVHLVPFGEYVPFAGKGSWLRGLLAKMALDANFPDLHPGNEWTVLTLSGAGAGEEDWHFATPICFEDAMPEPARRMCAPDSQGRKRVDFLVNISNDGWFFSQELDQHLQACQLRAVENRTPIIRAVNSGNSALVDSCGRVVRCLPRGTSDVMAWDVPVDSRISLYARIGDLLPILCGIATVLLVAWTFVRPRLGVKKEVN